MDRQQQMKTVTAFGYAHEVVKDAFTVEESDAIETAPYVHILAGYDDIIGIFVKYWLIEDQVALWSEVGELLLFTYEELKPWQREKLAALCVTVYVEDQSGMEVEPAA